MRVSENHDRARVRVLFAIPQMGIGGSERVLLTLLQHLDRARFEPHLVLLSMSAHHRALAEKIPRPFLSSVPQDIPVYCLGVERARYAVLPFVRLCHRLRPRAVLSMSAYLNSVVLISRPLLPPRIRLLTREGTTITSRDVTTNPLRMLWYKHLYRRADAVICQSDSMREQMIRGFGLASAKVARVYNPVDIELISKLAEPNPYSDSGPNLVTVARLFPEKRLDLLIRCMAVIRAAVPTAALTIVGFGDLEATLKAQSAALGLQDCVRFLGFQRNPYPFIRHADLLLLTSKYEGLPNAVLEALALGTPVVTTDCCGGLSEIASTTNRIRVVAADPDSLAAEAINVISRPKMTAAVEHEFVAQFGVRHVVSEYERLIQRTMEGRSIQSVAGTPAINGPGL
jgi:glycosyltransferase involved in cell wall biosynthesis